MTLFTKTGSGPSAISDYDLAWNRGRVVTCKTHPANASFLNHAPFNLVSQNWTGRGSQVFTRSIDHYYTSSTTRAPIKRGVVASSPAVGVSLCCERIWKDRICSETPHQFINTVLHVFVR